MFEECFVSFVLKVNYKRAIAKFQIISVLLLVKAQVSFVVIHIMSYSLIIEVVRVQVP